MNQYDHILNKISKYKDIDINELNLDDLVELKTIKISRRKSSTDRILDFLNEIENPYCFKVDGFIVKIDFNDKTSDTAEDCLLNILKDVYK